MPRGPRDLAVDAAGREELVLAAHGHAGDAVQVLPRELHLHQRRRLVGVHLECEEPWLGSEERCAGQCLLRSVS